MNFLKGKHSGLVFVVLVIFLGGCASLGHEDRSKAQLVSPVLEMPKRVAVVGSGDLSIALEKMLVARNIEVSAFPVNPNRESGTRYVIAVSSVSRGPCVPEGSILMHFSLSVTDIQTNKRVYVAQGEDGCRDTILRQFSNWFLGS